MFEEFLKAFALVFIAEAGDKTQLMLMTLASQYTAAQMLLGIFLGVVVNHGAAVAIGCYLSSRIEGKLIQIFAGFIFVAFGIITIVFDSEDEKGRNFKFGPVVTTALTFLIGEIGDKTQLTAMTLAMETQHPVLVLAGSVTSMLATGAVGIIIGTALTKYIPSNTMKIISGMVFIIFGLMRFIE